MSQVYPSSALHVNFKENVWKKKNFEGLSLLTKETMFPDTCAEFDII
jgi:hypothetical protein